jgi:hypothetical protein
LLYTYLTAPVLVFVIIQKLVFPTNGIVAVFINIVSFVLNCWAGIAVILAVKEAAQPRAAAEYITDAVAYLWPYMVSCVVWFGAVAVLGFPGIMGAGFLVMSQSMVQTILLSLFLVVWTVGLVAAIVYSAVRFSLFGFACVDQNLGPLASLKRSREICNRDPAVVAKTMLVYFCVAMFANLPVMVIGGLMGPNRTSEILVACLGFLLSIFLIPAQTNILAGLYDNLKEAS